MKQHNLQQGTPEWHKFRAEHFGASEASAMLGLSPYTSRSELLKAKATGITKDVDASTQRVFDRGHEVEALARPIIESQLGDDLYPVTASMGKLSASCDGLTMCGSIAWENKQFNAKLFTSISAGELPEHHWPQAQQVLYVTGAEKLIFTCSDGTPENTVSMDVYPDVAKHQVLAESWARFAQDLAEYTHAEVVEAPKAEAIMQLPALSIQIKGEVSLTNLPKFTIDAEKYLAEINIDLKTDQDFANAEAQAKDCREIAKTLELNKRAALAQTADIDELMRTIDHFKEKFNGAGLALEKMVKSEKENIKIGIMNTAVAAFALHKASLTAGITPIRLVVNNADFAGAMKNKRTLASLRDAVDTELANAKINMDSVAKDIRTKLAWCKESSTGFGFLFNDLSDLIYKAEDDFKLVVTTRIEAHKKDEADKIEAQRLQIQAEEEAKAKKKAEAEQAAKLESERQKMRDEEQARVDEERRLERIEFDKRQESERLANAELKRVEDERKFQELQQRKISAETAKHSANLVADVPEDIKPLVVEVPVIPTPEQLIKFISSHYSVPIAMAEHWIIEAAEAIQEAA